MHFEAGMERLGQIPFTKQPLLYTKNFPNEYILYPAMLLCTSGVILFLFVFFFCLFVCFIPFCVILSSTEDFGSLVIEGMFGGSLLLYHPLLNYREYKQTDEAFKETCCGAADMCGLFYERRPANNCTGYEPPVRSKIIIYF